MAIQSLQNFILGEQQTVTLGHAHERIGEYFHNQENRWQHRWMIRDHFGGRINENCYYAAGNGWGNKFKLLAFGEVEHVTPIALTILSSAFLVGCMVSAVFCAATGIPYAGMMAGIGAIFIVPLVPASYYCFKNYRMLQRTRSEMLNEDQVQDLVNQIVIALNNRQNDNQNFINSLTQCQNANQQLINRIQNGQQQN